MTTNIVRVHLNSITDLMKLRWTQQTISELTIFIIPLCSFVWSIANFEKKILGPAPTQAHWAQVQSGQGRVQILVKMWK